MDLRSHASKDHQGRCGDASPFPAKRSRSDPGKSTKVTQPKVKQGTSKTRAEKPSNRSQISLKNEHKSTAVTVLQESPEPSQNNNEKIELFDSKNASSSELREDHFVPLNSLPAAQAAFSIPKVREKILSFMNPRDLLELRLVSRDWRRDATNEALLNWDKNMISISTETVGKPVVSKNRNKYQNFKEPLQELTELMNKTGLYPFPCSQFNISLTNWKDEEEIQSFLTTHGYRIHKLAFSLCYLGDCEEMTCVQRVTICSHQQNWLFKIIAKLFFSQAPNLEKIKIDFNILGPTKKVCKSIVDNFIIDQTPQVFHTKLRSAEISGNITVSVFDFICRIAPNLTEFKRINLNYYLDPINRLYLLKDLAYLPYNAEPAQNLLIKRISNTDDKLSLQELLIRFPLWSSAVPEDWPEVADIINKLFEKSCHCLKKLQINSAEFFPGLKFPRMPNVNAVVLYGFLPNDEQRHFFPREVCLSDTFPKLTKLHIEPYTDSCREKYICGNDDFFLISSNKEVVYSVREIELNWDADGFGLEKYQRWFPNANIVDEGNGF